MKKSLGEIMSDPRIWEMSEEEKRRGHQRIMEIAKREIESGMLTYKDEEPVMKAQTYALTRKPDNSYVFHPHDSVVTDALVDMSDLPNARYHNRTFHKDYAKKKKAKRRQQKQARRRK